MKAIELNHWYIQDNEMSISLMNFYVSIQSFVDGKSSFYLLRVCNSDRGILNFSFPTLEDAVCFTEDKVATFFTLEDVAIAYMERREEKKQKRMLKHDFKR
ncbi:MAG: hypothetical protein IJI60_03925 [Bacilli bacterium]|nr:hypothetical protein [Bacilli bacterium]